MRAVTVRKGVQVSNKIPRNLYKMKSKGKAGVTLRFANGVTVLMEKNGGATIRFSLKGRPKTVHFKKGDLLND